MQLSCLLAVLQVLGSCDERAVNPELEAANPPPEQVEFCAIVEDLSDQYRPLYEQAKRERNGNSLDQLNAQMAGLFAARNQKVIESLQPRHFRIEEWVTKIQKIAHYAQDNGSGTVIELDLNANCRTRTTLQVDIADGTTLATALADRKVGDPLAITGTFMMHYTETTPPVRALEWSVTPGRSMLTPEYHIEVTRFGLRPSAS